MSISFLFIRPQRSDGGSYEDLEMGPLDETKTEEPTTPVLRKISVHRLVRQSSVMDTQKDTDGSMKMTYWF